MKQFIIFVLFALLASYGFSQDRIVTIQKDTIDCKITRITETYLHYLLIEENTRSRIRLDEVESYFQAPQQEVFDAEKPLGEAEEPDEISIEEEEEVFEFPNFEDETLLKSFRFSFDLGFSYQYDGYENFPSSYTQQARSLFNRGWGAHYFLNDGIGIGIDYTRVSTSTEEEFIGNLRNIEEEIRFDYVGVSVLNRKPTRAEGGMMYYGLGLGLITYRDDGTIDSVPFTEFGETLGLSLKVGYDYTFDEEFGIGVNLGVTLGTLDEVTVTTPSGSGTITGASFGVSRVDLTAGIRIFQ